MNPMRIEKLNSLLKEEIACLIKDLKDPRLGFVTVTQVMVSHDIKHAKVYVSVLGNEKETSDSIVVLNHAAGFIRSNLLKRVSIKYIPELAFHFDNSIERGTRILHIINSLNSDEVKNDES